MVSCHPLGTVDTSVEVETSFGNSLGPIPASMEEAGEKVSFDHVNDNPPVCVEARLLQRQQELSFLSTEMQSRLESQEEGREEASSRKNSAHEELIMVDLRSTAESLRWQSEAHLKTITSVVR